MSDYNKNTNVDTAAANSYETKWQLEILRAVRKLNYGSLEIVIHDSKVVQIEVREKLRFDVPRHNKE